MRVRRYGDAVSYPASAEAYVQYTWGSWVVIGRVLSVVTILLTTFRALGHQFMATGGWALSFAVTAVAWVQHLGVFGMQTAEVLFR